MSALPPLKPIDKWIFAMAAFSVVAIILGTRFAHTHHEILGDIFFFCGFTTLWALPSVAGTHIYFNTPRTPSAVLWVESLLVGILVMLAAQVLALTVFDDRVAAALSLTAGAAFALLPLVSRHSAN